MRGEDVKRIETFSDAVFAFAVTLLIVSLEVPKSYEELLVSMRGFFPFALCFALLVRLWYDQHAFFRRYALDDRLTIFLNVCLLFIVLFFVYPLKFLFTLLFNDQSRDGIPAGDSSDDTAAPPAGAIDPSAGPLDAALNDFAWSLGGRDDIHATAHYRRDLVRRLGRTVVQEALACAA